MRDALSSGMELTYQQSTVLEILMRGFPVSSADISMSTAMPKESIRRTVQELRKLGYEISYGLDGRNSVYHFHGRRS